MTETAPLTGTTVENRFDVLEWIGEGGMATVYKAKHKHVDLDVAIKVLNKDNDMTDVDIERLKREARALNTLFHPNIIKVYSFGFLDSGHPYLVLDFLKGSSLDDLIALRKMPSLEWTIETFMQICRGLDCAHESKMIHRDLKPSNIMIVEKDEEGSYVKLLDFGIARMQIQGIADQKLTRKGEIFGSPLYMSPEQISGKEIDHRADIYSLGCLMYEALSGNPPLLGDTIILTLMKHMTESPTAITPIFEQELPAGLEALVFKCMEKDPEKRFQSTKEIEAALLKCAQALASN
ncbi:MAG: serine/threonine protein kinase [Candidatus Obscuribacterales bacterium]|nr:serine/threonine protein kinase [Candidatus Obscuribacterales bacterium]